MKKPLELIRIDAAAPDRPTIVFLHEGLGSVALWRDFPAAVARRANANAVVYSRAGNGFSPVLGRSRQPSYMHDEALSVLPALLAELQIERPILIGHSDGGSIALIYAGAHPAEVRALVVLAPHVFVEDLSLRSIAAMRQTYETTDLPQRMARYHADAAATFYGWNDVWLAPEFRSWNIESSCEKIAAPLLAIQGTDDKYGTPAQLDAIAARTHGQTDCVLLARCGHAPHVDRREFVESLVADWLLVQTGSSA